MLIPSRVSDGMVARGAADVRYIEALSLDAVYAMYTVSPATIRYGRDVIERISAAEDRARLLDAYDDIADDIKLRRISTVFRPEKIEHNLPRLQIVVEGMLSTYPRHHRSERPAAADHADLHRRRLLDPAVPHGAARGSQMIRLFMSAALAAVVASAVHADQRLTTRPNGSVRISASAEEVTRISVAGDRIRRIIKDQTSFQEMNDETTGDVFLRYAGDKAKLVPETGYIPDRAWRDDQL